MSHAKIKPLTVFEGKGTSFVLFYHGCVGYKEALFCRIGSISQGARGAARLTSAAFLCNLYNCFLLFQWVVQRNKGWMCCAPSSRSTPTLGPRQREAVCSGVLLPTACPLPAGMCCLQSVSASTSQCWRIKQNHLRRCKWFNTCHENSCLDSEKIIINVDSILLLLDQVWSWGLVCQQQGLLCTGS